MLVCGVLCAGVSVSIGDAIFEANLYAAQGGFTAKTEQDLLAALENALQQGAMARAREVVDQMVALPSASGHALFKAGALLAQQESYAEASRLFERCADQHPEIFACHYNLALARLALQEFPQALEALAQTPKGSGEQELARRYLRGKIEDGQGNTQAAEADLTAAFAGAPQEENYALDLGLFYLRRESYARAAEVFERGTHSHPGSSFLWLGQALAEFQAGRSTQSIATCKRLIALETDSSAVRLLLAFELEMDGRLEEAEQVAREGLARPHPQPYLYYLDARILLKLHSSDYHRMLQDLESASKAIPDCALCALTASKVHEANGRTDAAVADLERSVKIDPQLSEAWYRLARLYAGAGRKAEAEGARQKFNRLKAAGTDREHEILRESVVKAMTGSGEREATDR